MRKKQNKALKKSFHVQRRWVQKKRAQKILALVGVVLGLYLFPFSLAKNFLLEKTENVKESFFKKAGKWVKLEEIVWQESGSTNLSSKVSKNQLLHASGLNLGDSLLALDLAETEKKILNVPWIESVRLQKKLPSQLVIDYTVHEARALGIRGNRVWFISSEGRWIAPIEKGAPQDSDLPFLADAARVESQLLWLETLEADLNPYLLQVHELRLVDRPLLERPRSESSSNFMQMQAIVEIKYASRSAKISLLAQEKPQVDSLNRLKHVVQYLIKNNILVSSLDMRSGQKVVVNVGKRL